MQKDLQLVEVGPRDGLQSEPENVDAATRVELIVRLIDAGARRIEVASFVNPRRVPQMAAVDAVIAELPDRPDVRYIGMCLNVRGVERALATRDRGRRGVDEAGCVLVASDTFGSRNQGQVITEGLVANRAMLGVAARGGLVPQVTIAAAFGCPFEGDVPPTRVVDLARYMVDAGAVEIALADTIGAGVPAQVTDLFGRVAAAIPGIRLRGHFHDTRGTGIANAWAAYQAGVQVLDASVGGLGGCPFARNATGNIATEDLLYLLDHSGVATGVDLAATIGINRWLAGRLGRELPSRVGRVAA